MGRVGEASSRSADPYSSAHFSSYSLHLPHHDSYLGLSTKLSAEKTDDKLEEEKTRGIIIF